MKLLGPDGTIGQYFYRTNEKNEKELSYYRVGTATLFTLGATFTVFCSISKVYQERVMSILPANNPSLSPSLTKKQLVELIKKKLPESVTLSELKLSGFKFQNSDGPVYCLKPYYNSMSWNLKIQTTKPIKATLSKIPQFKLSLDVPSDKTYLGFDVYWLKPVIEGNPYKRGIIRVNLIATGIYSNEAIGAVMK